MKASHLYNFKSILLESSGSFEKYNSYYDCSKNSDIPLKKQSTSEKMFSKQMSNYNLKKHEAGDKNALIELTMKPMKFQFYRTKLCPWIIAAGHCRKEYICHYAHSIQELRPLPNLAKTKMCKAYLNTKQCPNIANCKFAHSPKELRATQSFNKTKLCPLWQENQCNAGYYCRFAHGYEELRLNQYLRDNYGMQSSTLKSNLYDSDYAKNPAYNVSNSPTFPIANSSLLPLPMNMIKNSNHLAVGLPYPENETNNFPKCSQTQWQTNQAESFYAVEGTITPQSNTLVEGNESCSRFPSYLLPPGIFTPLTPQCVDYISTSHPVQDNYPSDAMVFSNQSRVTTSGATYLLGQDGRAILADKSPQNIQLQSPVYYNAASNNSYLTSSSANVMFSSFYPLALRTISTPTHQDSSAISLNKIQSSQIVNQQNLPLIQQSNSSSGNVIITNTNSSSPMSTIYPYIYSCGDSCYDFDQLATPPFENNEQSNTSSLLSTAATNNSSNLMDGNRNLIMNGADGDNLIDQDTKFFKDQSDNKNTLFTKDYNKKRNSWNPRQMISTNNQAITTLLSATGPSNNLYMTADTLSTSSSLSINQQKSPSETNLNHEVFNASDPYHEPQTHLNFLPAQSTDLNNTDLEKKKTSTLSDNQFQENTPVFSWELPQSYNNIATNSIYGKKKLSIDSAQPWNSQIKQKWARSNSTELLTNPLI